MSSVLDSVRIASPCPASWSTMEGDDRVRFCKQCQLSVYNLSALSRPEAEALVQQREGRLCVRYFQRADGTILTRDCPTGLRALRKRVVFLAAAVVSFIAVLLEATQILDRASRPYERRRLSEVQPIAMVLDRFKPVAPVQGVIVGMLPPPPRGTMQLVGSPRPIQELVGKSSH